MQSSSTATKGYRGELVGLAKRRPLNKLYVKMVGEAVRDHLRSEAIDRTRVAVANRADLIDSKWHGRCSVDGKEFEYQVFMEDGVASPVLWIPGLEEIKSPYDE